jgi:hypothetical protein
LFGETRQMGILLETEFNTRRVWIRVEKNVKLDCMFFKSTDLDKSS